jgi:hypothetical protein
VRIAGPAGPYFEIITAPSPAEPRLTVNLGFRSENFHRYMKFGLATSVAQYYGIVQVGLMGAQHLFRGLERPLMHDADMDADKNILIYAWRPKWDYEWEGTPWDGLPMPKVPREKRVFVVLVRIEECPEFNVYGSIEKWNWIMEDPELKDAPVEWNLRYAQKLWSRIEGQEYEQQR